MGKFKNGTHVNSGFIKGKHYKRIRVSAGPHRGKYVDTLILEAKLGRKLGPNMTVEHIDGDTFNFGECGSNLIEVTNEENVRRMWRRKRNAATAKALSEAEASRAEPASDAGRAVNFP
jgi:hypothetical protein